MKEIEWLIIGSRRWARVIADEVCKIQSSQCKVKIFMPRNDSSLPCWQEKSLYKQKLDFVEKLDFCGASKIGVAIVANSAYLHHSTIAKALDAGYHVVSEKPLTFSKKESMALLVKAKLLGLHLFSTNTYYFSNYFRQIKEEWLLHHEISKMEIHWSDPVIESRYGETKQYDSSTPIVYDILPHVAAIILATYGEVEIADSEIHVLNGGSKTKIEFQCSRVDISVFLERNSLNRKRSIQFSGTNFDLAFDFTEEPGKINLNKEFVNRDLDYRLKRKPIAEMLHCLRAFFKGGAQDPRLSSDVALLGNDLIDSIASQYVEQQKSFLNLQNQSESAHEDYRSYANKEISSLSERVSQYLSKESPLNQLVSLHKGISEQHKIGEQSK